LRSLDPDTIATGEAVLIRPRPLQQKSAALETPQLSYIGPLAPIIGAIIGAVITAVVGYFFLAKRQSITFWVADSEDITLPLRREHRDIIFTVGDMKFANVNRGSIWVKNTGNSAIEKLAFDITIPETHEQFLPLIVTHDTRLRKSIEYEQDNPEKIHDPVLPLIFLIVEICSKY
jgi:hypothetical protein